MRNFGRLSNLTALARGASVGMVVSTEMKRAQVISYSGVGQQVVRSTKKQVHQQADELQKNQQRRRENEN
ncbi:MAG: hypothetical protein AABZ00_03155 [Chloroflexota bacterium]